MAEKIFGEIPDIDEINELANNLRKTKEFDEVRLLCKENGISEEIAERFIKGDQLILANAEARCDLEKDSIGFHTIDDVKKKLEAELQIYRDGDSKYVIEKLIDRCEADKELLNAIMLPHKSYDKAFQYFYEKSRTVGYKMPHGNMVYLDNDRAVEMSVEYFKKEDKVERVKKVNGKTEQQKEKPVLKKNPDTPAEEVNASKQPVPMGKPEEKKIPERPRQDTKNNRKEIAGQISLFDF